jgi:hypothetical protein
MPQSSALRREETIPTPTPITISSQGVPNPKNSSIGDDGSVTFNTGQQWWLYFSPVGVFGNPQGLLELNNAGPNGPYYPQESNVTVSYCVTAPNSTCDPTVRPPDNGGNTIKVG